MSKLLVTGAAGFIGAHVTRRLVALGHEVVGLDNLDAYYSQALKRDRLRWVAEDCGSAFRFVEIDLRDAARTEKLFADERFARVVHLAAQPGVRYSIDNPRVYIESNVAGFLNVLEGCRHNDVEHMVYASSSSVYGANTTVPYSVHQNVDHPVSLYAATKKANELMAHTYSHLYGIPVTGLRFFTVYGPWGRPDMAYFSFTKAILADQPIPVFNHGRMRRDFTYVDDIVEGVTRTVARVAAADPQWSGDHPDPASSRAPYRLYNIGNHTSVELLDFIATIERALGKKAVLQMRDMQPGDVRATFADVDDLERDVGFAPCTPLDVGIGRFVEWYREYYRV